MYVELACETTPAVHVLKKQSNIKKLGMKYSVAAAFN